MGLAIDAVKLAPKLDTVIIASGDGDFIPLVEYLKNNEGCQVEVIAFGKSASGKLKETCDDFVDLSDDPKRFIMGYNARRMSRGPYRGGAGTTNGKTEPENGAATPAPSATEPVVPIVATDEEHSY